MISFVVWRSYGLFDNIVRCRNQQATAPISAKVRFAKWSICLCGGKALPLSFSRVLTRFYISDKNIHFMSLNILTWYGCFPLESFYDWTSTFLFIVSTSSHAQAVHGRKMFSQMVESLKKIPQNLRYSVTTKLHLSNMTLPFSKNNSQSITKFEKIGLKHF